MGPRHDGEISLPIDESSRQLRKKLVDKLSEIFHDGQRDDHSRKLVFHELLIKRTELMWPRQGKS